MSDASFTDKVEGAIESFVGFLQRFARTVRLLVTHPVRAPSMLLGPEPDPDHVPPLTFIVVGYVAAITALAVARRGSDPDSGWEAKYRSVAAALQKLDISPESLLALALPMLVVLLGCAYALRRATRLERRVCIGMIAYSAAPWLLLLIGWAATAAALQVVDALGGPLLVQLVLMIAFLAATVVGPPAFIAAFLKGAVALAVAGRRGMRRVAVGLVVVAATVAAHVMGLQLVALASAAPPTPAPPEVAVLVRELRLGADLVPAVPLVPGAVQHAWVPRVHVKLLQSPLRFSFRMGMVLENRTPDAVTIARDPPYRHSAPDAIHTLQIVVDSAAVSERMPLDESGQPLRPRFDVPLRIIRWTDTDAPVLVLMPGAVKWIEAEAVVPGIATACEFERLIFRVRIATGGEPVVSPWQWGVRGVSRPDELPIAADSAPPAAAAPPRPEGQDRCGTDLPISRPIQPAG